MCLWVCYVCVIMGVHGVCVCVFRLYVVCEFMGEWCV